MNNTQIAILTILLLDLLVAATRASLLNARYARLLAFRNQQEAKANRTIELVNQRPHLSASLKLAQNLFRFIIIGFIFITTLFQNNPQLSSLSLILILSLFALLIWFFELIVERVVLRAPEKWALRLTPLARFVIAALSPLSALPLRFAELFGPGPDNLITINETELKSLVDVSQRAGLLEKDERKMIYSIFQFGDTLAREIMVPRIDMFSLNVDTPLKDAADAVLKTGYSRVPVYEQRIDNILGMLYTKDMLKAWRDGNQKYTLRSLLRPANFIPETKKVDDLLSEMQAERTHIAIVVDEYGGVAGLVTLEDIVEEIFGEIQDEYDDSEESLSERVTDDEYIFHGRIDLDDVNTIFESQLDTSEVDTLGGLIYSRLGRVPKIGDTLEEDCLLLTIEQVAHHRIRKVRVLKKSSPDTGDGKNQKEASHAK